MTLRAESRRGTRRQLSGAVLAILSLLWFGIAGELAARAATGFASHIFAGVLVPLLQPVFLLFLLAFGLALLESGRAPVDTWSTAGLPRRSTVSKEWAVGAAIGWGVAILATLPLVFSRRLLLSFWTEPRGWLTALIVIAGALLTTLASEIAYRGYGLRRLEERLGRTSAVVLIGLVYAVVVGVHFGTWRTAMVAFLFSVLLSIGWLRTHAIWLSWGLHFAWNVGLGVLFGLPVLDGGDLASVIQGQVRGRSHWLGASLGPINSWWTALVMLVGIGLLVAATREFAWLYTHRPIVAAGYPMDIPPPAAHAAMAQTPAPPLVQILPLAPSAPPPPRPTHPRS